MNNIIKLNNNFTNNYNNELIKCIIVYEENYPFGSIYDDLKIIQDVAYSNYKLDLTFKLKDKYLYYVYCQIDINIKGNKRDINNFVVEVNKKINGTIFIKKTKKVKEFDIFNWGLPWRFFKNLQSKK